MQERRKYIRIPIVFKVKYTVEDGRSQKFKEGVSRNLSQGGLLLSAQEPMPVSMGISLEITGPTLLSPISVRGRVVRVEEIEKDKYYDIGIAFTNILEKDSEFIKQYIQAVDLNNLLSLAIKKNASDLHLTTGQPPILRIHGELTPMPTKPLTGEEVKGMIFGFLTDHQRELFEKDLELDISYAIDAGRFRVNIHQEKGQMGAAFRYIPTEIRTVEELELPLILKELALKPNGLILVTGPTGSGKSTTLAAMIDFINKQKNSMIISLEDPIEYLHKSRKSTIKQREIGFDSLSFVNALKHTLRQDVDVILVGEVRDLDSISIAITAAETGHLVLTTLHTSDAPSAISRIIDVFPSSQQQQIRMQLAECLRGVVAQILVPRLDKVGRVVATEVLVATHAISNTIRQGNTEQIMNCIQTGAQYGMQTMDKTLADLCKKGIISKEIALAHVKDAALFEKIITAASVSPE